MATVRGQVKWFDDQKGYGFISQEGGKDVFVHFRAITSPGVSSLRDGQEVEFMKGMTLRQADDKVYKLVRGIRQWGNDPSKLNFDNQPMSPERVILKKNGQAIPHGYKGNEQKPITGELGENEASMKGMYIPNTSNPVYEKMRKFLKFAQEQGFTDVKHLLDNNTSKKRIEEVSKIYYHYNIKLNLFNALHWDRDKKEILQMPIKRSKPDMWAGAWGTSFWIDPKLQLVGVLMAQAPSYRVPNRMLYKNLVYGAM